MGFIMTFAHMCTRYFDPIHPPHIISPVYLYPPTVLSQCCQTDWLIKATRFNFSFLSFFFVLSFIPSFFLSFFLSFFVSYLCKFKKFDSDLWLLYIFCLPTLPFLVPLIHLSLQKDVCVEKEFPPLHYPILAVDIISTLISVVPFLFKDPIGMEFVNYREAYGTKLIDCFITQWALKI
jgi:hypothetical protein